MTLSTLKRWDVRGGSPYLRITLVWFDRMTKYGVVTEVGISMFLVVNHAPTPNGLGLSVPETCEHTV